MKHTPGPWRIYKQDDSEHPGIETENLSIVIYGIRDEDDGGIRGESIEQEMANARLIAAAPELLGALKALIPYAQNHCDAGPFYEPRQSDELSAIIAKAESVIAKAENFPARVDDREPQSADDR